MCVISIFWIWQVDKTFVFCPSHDCTISYSDKLPDKTALTCKIFSVDIKLLCLFICTESWDITSHFCFLGVSFIHKEIISSTDEPLLPLPLCVGPLMMCLCAAMVTFKQNRLQRHGLLFEIWSFSSFNEVSLFMDFQLIMSLGGRIQNSQIYSPAVSLVFSLHSAKERRSLYGGSQLVPPLFKLPSRNKANMAERCILFLWRV